MTQSVWSSHYPDRWLPDEDPRWREHDGSDTMPCPPDMLVEALLGRERFKSPTAVADDRSWKWVAAWRPAEPNVWHIEKGDIGDLDIERLKVGDIKALSWARPPQVHPYWSLRAAGRSLMTNVDRAFIAAVIAAYDEPATSAPRATQTQIGGDHYSKLAIQPVEYIEANGLGFSEGCVVKYVTRWRDKGGVKDLEKAAHFLQMMIEREERK